MIDPVVQYSISTSEIGIFSYLLPRFYMSIATDQENLVLIPTCTFLRRYSLFLRRLAEWVFCQTPGYDLCLVLTRTQSTMIILIC